MNQTKTISSQDFYLSCFLVASGIELQSSSRTNGLTTFTFADDAATRQLISKYHSLSATINPVAYCNAIRNLKSILHSTPEQRENYVKQPNSAK
jgi:hypothetical protein